MHDKVEAVAANMLDEGVANQFEFQPLKTTTTTSTSLLHDQFSLQTQSNNNLFYPSILSLPHHSSKQHHNHTTTFNSPFNFQIQNQLHHQLPPSDLIDSGWTNDELLALFKIRSTIENCFPDHLTWDHVSRKLEEVGFKKSADKCKEKFEDENTSFLKINNHNDFATELQSLYQTSGVDELDENEKTHHEEDKLRDEDNIDIVVTKQCDDDEEHKVVMETSKVDRKRKRKSRGHDKFKMLKCFCETLVNKMMAQQEEIHNKLIQDMLKRDQEKLAREEEWKKQEMERRNMMTQEQAISIHRQSTIIDFLKKHLSTNENSIVNNKTTKVSFSSQLHSQNPNNHEPSSTTPDQNPSWSETVSLVPSTSSNNTNNNKNAVLEDKRRWPRDEVLSLINLKCTTTAINRRSNKNSIEEKKEESKGPVWERISEGMSELGYKRSAKRCKEKWENINKYFRKTKDGVVNKKKRRMDSRTCPYFHQLSSLYNQQQQGKVIVPQNQLTFKSAGQIDDQPQAQSD